MVDGKLVVCISLSYLTMQTTLYPGGQDVIVDLDGKMVTKTYQMFAHL